MMFKINHSSPGDVYADFILLPLGLKMNRNIISYKSGDRIKFLDGKVYYIISAGVLDISNPVVAGLCFLRYGITLKKMMLHWTESAIAYGYGKKAVSKEECLLIVYGSKEDAEAIVSRWSPVIHKMQVQEDTDSPA